MSIETAVQVGIRSRLAGTAGVTALVPAGKILDRSQRPIIDPSIILGEGHSIEDEDALARDRWRVVFTVHVWKKEPGLAGVRSITWAIRTAIRPARIELGADFHCVDCHVTDVRHLRDPDGETAHGVVTIETLVEIVE
ncbi:DUF3168 domain-containing protein [Ensifer sp. PDNC004]|uniref:DUF3168 domain-containing protein n=1 Tax=Ensifer sp. PDNC004 TaxID=2811423 RepID=UPI001965E041|nr:DUF3168 domain-containing protein [Ensifer sp. PDNC004]QRY66551.1 DUF3168 domain-containing protein [Ensifer sp. PDNC004]